MKCDYAQNPSITRLADTRAIMQAGNEMNRQVVFCITAGALILATTALGQKETFVPANDVAFTVTTEHRSYQAGEQLIVKYEIANVSNGKSLRSPRMGRQMSSKSSHLGLV